MTRMTRRWAAAVSAVSMIAGLGACGSDDGGSAERRDASAGGIAGETLYGQACASCHGTDLRGTEKGPSHLSQVYEPNHHPDDAFRNAVAHGVVAHHWNFGDMPAVGGLSDAEVDAIIAYVREVQEREGFEPYPPE